MKWFSVVAFAVLVIGLACLAFAGEPVVCQYPRDQGTCFLPEGYGPTTSHYQQVRT